MQKYNHSSNCCCSSRGRSSSSTYSLIGRNKSSCRCCRCCFCPRRCCITVKYLVNAPPPPPPPLKHKFLRKVGGGRLLGILPFVQSIIQPLKVQVNTKDLNSNKNPIYSNFKTKGKRKLVIFKHTHPVYLSQSKTGHIATENHSHNFRFPLALLLRFIVSFSSSLK